MISMTVHLIEKNVMRFISRVLLITIRQIIMVFIGDGDYWNSKIIVDIKSVIEALIIAQKIMPLWVFNYYPYSK